MRTGTHAVAFAVLAAALAGCTGNFDVKQTEPLRIQLEGAPATTTVTQASPTQQVVLTKPAGVEAIRVDVVARPAAAQPAKVVVIVEDRDDGRELDREEMDVRNTTTQSLDVDVRGSDNIVVVAQSLQGDANVEVAAHDATVANGAAGTNTGASGNTTSTSAGGNATSVANVTQTVPTLP